MFVLMLKSRRPLDSLDPQPRHLQPFALFPTSIRQFYTTKEPQG